MTVLKAKIGGQWVPIGGDSDYARWNSAWGIVSMPSPRLSVAEPITTTSTGVYLTEITPFTTIVGRRYRFVTTVRAINRPSYSFFLTWTNGFDTGGGIPGFFAYWVHDTPASTWGGTVAEWIMDGDGVTRNYAVLAQCPDGTAQLYHQSSDYYIEDMGPVSGAVPIPNPTPAWITPTLLAPWANRGGETVQYRKIGDMVQIRGNPIGQAGNNLFQLPIGYRPHRYTRFSTVSFAAAEATASRGDISDVNGYVLPSTPNTSNAIWQLDGIQFSVTP